jgi:hypothetical protein
VPQVVHVSRKSTLATLSLLVVKKLVKLQQSTNDDTENPTHLYLVWSSEEVDMEDCLMAEPSEADGSNIDVVMIMEDPNIRMDLDSEVGTEEADEDSDKSESSKKRQAVEKRQSMRVKRLQTEKEDEVMEGERELESLDELNDIMPKGFQFGSDMSSFPPALVDFEKLLNQVQRDVQLKAGYGKEEKGGDANAKQYSLQFENWESSSRHPFFDSINLGLSFLESRLEKTTTIGRLAIDLVLFTVRHTISHPEWTIKISYIMCAILQLHTYICDPMKTIFGMMDHLTNSEDKIEILLFLAEMLLDSLTDQAGKELFSDHDLELYGSNENPMLKTSRKNQLDKVLNVILPCMDSSSPKIDHLIRCKWLFAKYEEIFGTPRSTVDALLDCFELFSGSDEAKPITLISCNRDNVIDLPSVTTKIKYQQLRLKIDETEYLANDAQYGVVVDRLETLLLPHSGSTVGQDIVAAMPHQKRLNLLQLLNLVFKSNVVS